MPYIPKTNRTKLIDGKVIPASAGELNFLITYLCNEYMRDDLCYDSINEVIGVLECCKQELYRRIAGPYEDIKCKENGDVYESSNKGSTRS